MSVHKPIRLRPQTIITDFGYNNQTFSCDISFVERLQLLFSKRVWFKMHGTQINRLAQGMSHNGLPINFEEVKDDKI